MALLDVSKVTETLINLIEQHVTTSPAWPASSILSVTPEPPDQLNGDNTIGLYLYHMEEDPHYKNLPAMDNPSALVNHTSMGLNLHYQLTAHSDLAGSTGTYQEQLMMGLATKALHAFPVIDDSTVVAMLPVMPSILSGEENRFRISLTVIPPSEAVSYWTAGSSPLRLASYYVASVILLEPDELLIRPGRVLRRNVFAFARDIPRLTSSYSILGFTVPGDTLATEVEASPAQVSPRDPALPPGPPLPAHTFTFIGSSLSGVSTNLLLRNARWNDPVEVDAAWGLQVGTDGRGAFVRAEVQQTVGGQDIVPGIYSGMVRVTVERIMEDGSAKQFQWISNEMPFVIVPRLDPIPDPDATGLTQITGYIFQHADLSGSDVRMYAGDTSLTENTSGPLSPGEFVIVNSATVSIRLPPGLTSGAFIPVRVLVNGAESAPQWVQAP